MADSLVVVQQMTVQELPFTHQRQRTGLQGSVTHLVALEEATQVCCTPLNLLNCEKDSDGETCYV